jgi:hypothetical protein
MMACIGDELQQIDTFLRAQPDIRGADFWKPPYNISACTVEMTYSHFKRVVKAGKRATQVRKKALLALKPGVQIGGIDQPAQTVEWSEIKTGTIMRVVVRSFE